MREQVEDVFLEWQLGLEALIRDRIEYQEYESKLQTVFVLRLDEFDRTLLADLESLLQQKVSPLLLVSSLVAIPL